MGGKGLDQRQGNKENNFLKMLENYIFILFKFFVDCKEYTRSISMQRGTRL